MGVGLSCVVWGDVVVFCCMYGRVISFHFLGTSGSFVYYF